MIDIIITLAFSVAMVLFMVYPAMKIVEWCGMRVTTIAENSDRWVLIVTILLSLLVGIFLRFV